MQKPILFTTLALGLGALAFTPDSKAQSQGTNDVDLPHRFSAGTRALASEVNENFETLATAATSAKTRLEAVEIEQTALLSQVTDAEDAIDSLGSQVSSNSSAISDLEDSQRPANTILVATENGDFTSVVEALASITGASVDNPFLVQVAPGRYTETEVALVPEGVHLRGSGPETTVIVTERSGNTTNETAAAVRLFDLGRISNIGITNTGASQISVGLLGFDLSSETVVDRVHVSVEGSGGSGHFAMHVSDSDLKLRNSLLVASGATTVNSAFGSVDNGGPFAQPTIENSELRGLGITAGIGAQISSTAMTVTDSLIRGEAVAVSATVNGISRLHHARIETLGLNPVYSTTGSASVLSAGVSFVGGNPDGLSSSFVYVHCYKANFNPVVNGTGSTVQ